MIRRFLVLAVGLAMSVLILFAANFGFAGAAPRVGMGGAFIAVADDATAIFGIPV